MLNIRKISLSSIFNLKVHSNPIFAMDFNLVQFKRQSDRRDKTIIKLIRLISLIRHLMMSLTQMSPPPCNQLDVRGLSQVSAFLAYFLLLWPGRKKGKQGRGQERRKRERTRWWYRFQCAPLEKTWGEWIIRVRRQSDSPRDEQRNEWEVKKQQSTKAERKILRPQSGEHCRGCPAVITPELLMCPYCVLRVDSRSVDCLKLHRLEWSKVPLLRVNTGSRVF